MIDVDGHGGVIHAAVAVHIQVHVHMRIERIVRIDAPRLQCTRKGGSGYLRSGRIERIERIVHIHARRLQCTRKGGSANLWHDVWLVWVCRISRLRLVYTKRVMGGGSCLLPLPRLPLPRLRASAAPLTSPPFRMPREWCSLRGRWGGTSAA